jgi:putative peptidoglycan lipid II flippase
MALLRSSLIVGSNTLVSRALGFLRDILIARTLGTTGLVEAFFVAFRFPNLFRRLVAEGAFAAAFVPMYARKLERDGPEEALRFAGNIMAWLLLVLAVFTVAAEIFMPAIIAGIAPGFRDDPAQFGAAVLFTRITLPYLIAMTIVALMSGILNVGYKFAMAAAAPSLLNVIMIVGLLFAVPWFKSAGHMLSWAVALAGIAQYVWLGYACWKAGLHLRLPLPHFTASTRRLLRLMVPGLIGGGMTQINILVGSTVIASFLPAAVSILYFADRIYQFPLGMIGIAIGTALLPELSRRIHTDAGVANLLQNRAVEISMLLTLPAAAALVAVAGPITTVMFQYGRFTAADAHGTAVALMGFSCGLPAYVLIRVFAPGFYAREDTRSPVIYAVVSMAANIVLSVAFVWPPFGLPSMGSLGIAVATAIAAWINAGLLAVMLAKRGHWRIDAGLKTRLPRLVLAAVLMAAALVPLSRVLDPWLHGAAYGRVAAMIALVAAGMIVYGGLCVVLKAADLDDLKRMLRRRRARKGERPAPPPPTGK